MSVKRKDRLDGHVHGVEAVVLEHDLKQHADEFHRCVSSRMRRRPSSQGLAWFYNSHLNHFLPVLEGIHWGLCQHDFALFGVDVHLLLAKRVILFTDNFKIIYFKIFSRKF